MNIRLAKSTKIISKDDEYVLINTARGSWSRVSPELLNIINELETSSLSGVLHKYSRLYSTSEEAIYGSIQALLERNILESYASFLLNRSSDNAIFTETMRVHLNVTDGCNLNCKFCYANSKPRHAANFMALEDVESIADKLGYFAANYNIGIEVDVTGGEPLIHNDISHILEILHSRSFYVVMITNGVLLSPNICDKIISVVSEIIVSLDGSTPLIHDKIRGKGTFFASLSGIAALQDRRFEEISIKATVCKKNWQDIPNMVSLAKSLRVNLQVDSVCLSGFAYINRDSVKITCEQEDWVNKNTLLKAEQENYIDKTQLTLYMPRAALGVRCGAARSELSIAVDGSVYPCLSLMLPEYNIGNIIEAKSIAKLLNKSSVFTELNQKDIDNIPECADCDVRYICNGHCIYHQKAYPEEELKEMCLLYKRWYGLQLWKWQDGVSISEYLSLLEDGMNDEK